MILVLYRKIVSIKHKQTKEAQNKPLNVTYQSMITLTKKVHAKLKKIKDSFYFYFYYYMNKYDAMILQHHYIVKNDSRFWIKAIAY